MDFIYQKLLLLTHNKYQKSGYLLILCTMTVLFLLELLVNINVASALSLIVGFLGSQYGF